MAFEYVREWNAEREKKGWWHSFELPDGRRIDGVCSLESLRHRIAQFPIPENLRGKRVLDIGTWDGWFAFEMERRGAEVTAIDTWDNPRFHEAHALLNSQVKYLLLDVYELAPDRVGRFDIVLFMGVLYHLKHPLLALERVCALTTEMAAVDSFVLRDEPRPILEFYETTEFGGQTDNWVGPSVSCLEALCRTAGFARVELQKVIEHSACIACYRQWLPVETNAPGGPEILDVFHHRDFGINFRSDADEYLAVSFRYASDSLTLADVQPHVGPYGSRPIELKHPEPSLWQVAFRLPPGLPAGMHHVSIALKNSQPARPRRIAVDLPKPTKASYTGVSDGTTWRPNELELSKGQSLTIWTADLPENADHNNIPVYLDATRLQVTYVSPNQINARVPQGLPPGDYTIRLMDGPRLPVHVIH